MSAAVIFDIDGTLVDSNYQHALAWFRALRRHDVTVPVWRIHRGIGMGGDKLIAAVAGDQVEREQGDAIREAEGPLYKGMIDEIVPFDGARELLDAFRSARLTSAGFDQYTRLSRLKSLLDAGSIDDNLRWSYTHERA